MDPGRAERDAVLADDDRDTLMLASDIVSLQAECSFREALLMVCDRARVHHLRLVEVAVAVVDRRMRFSL
jgi:hypothetical protein